MLAQIEAWKNDKAQVLKEVVPSADTKKPKSARKPSNSLMPEGLRVLRSLRYVRQSATDDPVEIRPFHALINICDGSSGEKWWCMLRRGYVIDTAEDGGTVRYRISYLLQFELSSFTLDKRLCS
jgi:hypothetical protein